MKNITDLLQSPVNQEVQGWMNKRVVKILYAWSEIYQKDFLGDADLSPALEIGVHHGKLFLNIETLTPESVECFAVDVFDDQDKNIDNSGKGNLSIFLSNVEKFARKPSRVVPVKTDSFSIKACNRLSHRYSIISIDGGHTREHTGFDLDYANNTIQPGGLVILDDFSNVNWLGVMEGTLDFLYRPTRRIAPFMAGYNKLFLTTITESEKLRILLEKFISKNFDDVVLKRLSLLRGHLVRGIQ